MHKFYYNYQRLINTQFYYYLRRENMRD